jgi:hypothetical protein
MGGREGGKENGRTRRRGRKSEGGREGGKARTCQNKNPESTRHWMVSSTHMSRFNRCEAKLSKSWRFTSSHFCS